MNLSDLEELVRSKAEEMELDLDCFEIPGGIDDASEVWQEKVEEAVRVWVSKNGDLKPSGMLTEAWLKVLVKSDVVEESASYLMYRLLEMDEDLPWEGLISSDDIDKSLVDIGVWFSAKLGKEHKKFSKQLKDAAYEACKAEEEEEELEEDDE